MDEKNCSDDPLFVTLVERLHTLEPSAASAYYLGFLNDKRGKSSEALKYYEESIELETDKYKKAKILYKGPEPGTLIQHFKDDATANNNEKMDVFEGKGVINNRISEHLFTLLSSIDIPHHFIKRLNMREQLINEVEIIPLEVVIRNIAAGSLTRRLGIPSGEKLNRTIVEFYYKDDALQDPLVSEEHILTYG